MIDGDFNANIGRRNARQGLCGKEGVGRLNEAGRDLFDWCEEYGLVYVINFEMENGNGDGNGKKFIRGRTTNNTNK